MPYGGFPYHIMWKATSFSHYMLLTQCRLTFTRCFFKYVCMIFFLLGNIKNCQTLFKKTRSSPRARTKRCALFFLFYCFSQTIHHYFCPLFPLYARVFFLHIVRLCARVYLINYICVSRVYVCVYMCVLCGLYLSSYSCISQTRVFAYDFLFVCVCCPWSIRGVRCY